MNTLTKPKIYLIAGEASGDLLGSRLMRALREQTDTEFYGIGGDTMRQAGLNSLFDISELAVMGLVEVIPSIPRVLRRINETVNDIVSRRPDIVITIDSWSFSCRVHKALRRLNTGIRQVHYVAPQVWAWKKRRARTMYKYIDELLTILPDEERYFTPYHLRVSYVGHPVVESAALSADGSGFRQAHNIPDEAKVISILPGSRRNEVARLSGDFLQAAEMLYQHDKNLFFVLPTVSTVAAQVRSLSAKCHLPLVIVETEAERYGAFQASSAAIAASGTVALELAICHIPHLIAYKVAPLTYLLAKNLVDIKYVNLTNILLDKPIIPELLQYECTPEHIADITLQLLEHSELYERQMAAFGELRSRLGGADITPSQKAAARILELIR